MTTEYNKGSITPNIFKQEKSIQNDNAYLQSLLDRGGEVVFPPVNPRTGAGLYEIAEPLILRSETHLTVDGAILRLCDGVYANMFMSEGAWDKTIPEHHDIAIRGINGALLDGGCFNGLTEKTENKNGLPSVLHNTFILMSNVKGFAVEGLAFQNPRYWNMTFHYCSEGSIKNIVFNSENNAPNQDGIDLRRGCHDILIEGISGSTGDDTVALTGLLYGDLGNHYIPNACQDIYNVIIKNVNAEVTGGHGIIRLLCHDGIKLHHVTMENIYDRLIDTGRTRNQGAIRIGDSNYFTVRPMESGEMHDISISELVTNAKVAVKVYGEIPKLIMTNIHQK